MSSNLQNLPTSFVQDIKTIIGQARTKAVRSVEFHRVEMYWKLGERIFTEQQQGKERADYRTYLIRNLALEIEPEFGSGFFSSSIRALPPVLSHISNCVRTADAIELPIAKRINFGS